MNHTYSICWFRQDLRLSDNPALVEAAKQQHVLPIYILDTVHEHKHPTGQSSAWWLHHSLDALDHSLNGNLSIYKGTPLDILTDLISRLPIKSVCWNRCYEPWSMERDAAIKSALTDLGIDVITSNGSLLWEPWTVTKSDKTPYKVFTPFYQNGCLQATPPREPLPEPIDLEYHQDSRSQLLEQLNLIPNTDQNDLLSAIWIAGEHSAQQTFDQFMDNGLSQYAHGRDFPDTPAVSRLSPHLHFGEISPHQIWHTLRASEDSHNIDTFCKQLGWRDFSYSQLFYHPKLQTENLQRKFDHFPWQHNSEHLGRWQQGNTGIPMVDAGMRELLKTGYMHNRVRMIVGSFLVKNLRLHWHHGEQWFWENLVDADLANNSASWQWVAGCGLDAAPYFRIFNPVTQGQKFDPNGNYIRKYIPELQDLPTKYLYSPWEAPPSMLSSANIQLGKTYPLPIVDLKESRRKALEAFKTLKQKD